MAPPTTFGVVAEREVYLVKEAVPGTIPAGLGVAVPVTDFKPSNKPLWIPDESMQGHMGDNSGIYQGPLIASFDIGGHVTGDTFPHFAYNIMGDYTTSGTAASPASTTNATMAAGVTAVPVASGGASFTTGMFLWLEDAGSPAASEVVMVTSTGSATSIPVTATRFAHATAMPFTNTTAPYVHVFSLLNGSVGAANGPAQGPTHTVTDREGVTANGAAQFAYSVMSELTVTGNAEKLLDWSGKFTCLVRTAAGSAIGTTNVSAVVPYTSWQSAVGVGGLATGGSQVKDVPEWSYTISRTLKVFNTTQGSQAPYVIARGKLNVTGKNTIGPAIDDTNVIALLANTQPQLQYVAGNGLSGASLVKVQADIVLGAYETADITEDVLFGYDVPWKAVSTASAGAGSVTTTGASGGKSPLKLTITNAVPTY